jgi:hypothetical protein
MGTTLWNETCIWFGIFMSCRGANYGRTTWIIWPTCAYHCLHREAATIRISLAQLGFPYHMTYADHRPTYINPHLDPPKYEPVQRYREHSTHYIALIVLDGFVEVCYMVLPPSLHSQCTVVVSHNRIARIYWAYQSMWPVLQSLDSSKPTTVRSSIYIGGGTTLRLHSQCKPAVVWPLLGLNLTLLPSWYSQPINRVEKSKVKLLLSNDETIIWPST